MERRDRFLPPYISTRFTARLLTILLLFTAAVSGLSAGFEISQLHLLAGIGNYADVDEETRWAHTFIRNTLLVSRLLLYGSIAVAFITWLHRCRINVRAFGCRRFRYSRTWAIIGFFIPIVNFFRPDHAGLLLLGQGSARGGHGVRACRGTQPEQRRDPKRVITDPNTKHFLVLLPHAQIHV